MKLASKQVILVVNAPQRKSESKTQTHTQMITTSQLIPNASPIFSPKHFMPSATSTQKFGGPSRAISDLRVIVSTLTCKFVMFGKDTLT